MWIIESPDVFFFFIFSYLYKAFHSDLKIPQWIHTPGLLSKQVFPVSSLVVTSPVCRHLLIYIYTICSATKWWKRFKNIFCLFNKLSTLRKEGKGLDVHCFLFLFSPNNSLSQGRLPISDSFTILCLRHFHSEFFFVCPQKETASQVYTRGGNLLKRNRMSAYKIVSKPCHQKN